MTTMIANYACADLHLAAFLKAKHGLQLSDVRTEGRRHIFVFEVNGHDIQAHIREFFNGGAQVDATQFIRELRDLKSLIHNYGG